MKNEIELKIEEISYELGNKLASIMLIINSIFLILQRFYLKDIIRKYESLNSVIGINIFLIINLIVAMIVIIGSYYKTKMLKIFILGVNLLISIMEMLIKSEPYETIVNILYFTMMLGYMDIKSTIIVSIISLIGPIYYLIMDIMKYGNLKSSLYANFYLVIVIELYILGIILCQKVKKILINLESRKVKDEKEERNFFLANKIQNGFLNHDFINNKFYEVKACMYPTEEVGGDFYDFFMIDNANLGLIIADVSGKGIPAALFMANAKTILKAYLQNTISLEKSFEKANRNIIAENKEMQFITVFICVINLVSGKMNFINAAHTSPYIMHKNGDGEYLVSKPDFVFGVRKNVRYHSREYKFLPGDKMFLYTDGVSERLNLNDELYGKERLKEVLDKNYDKSASDIISNVLTSITEYANGRAQNDDITCLTFDYKSHLVLEEPIAMDFDLTKCKVYNINEFIKNVFIKKDIPEKITSMVEVATDEIVSNIIKYSYKEDDVDKYLDVSVQVINQHIDIVFTYGGIYFDPLNKISFSSTAKVTDKSKIGGLGIQLTWNIMDKVTYNRIDDSNVIHIIKEY